MSAWSGIVNNGVYGKKKPKNVKKVTLNGIYRSLRNLVKDLTVTHPTQLSVEKCVKLLIEHHKLNIEPSKKNAAEVVRLIKGTNIERPKEKKIKPAKQLNFKDFYKSWEWKKARYEALKRHGAKCQCCGATKNEAKIVVDHIKPLRFHWDLRLDQSNLQVLCDDCNMGKSFHDTTDWRNPV